MQFTQESDNINFIIHDPGQSDYVDFISQKSLSLNGYTLPNSSGKQRFPDLQPPPNSNDKKDIMPILSPTHHQQEQQQLVVHKQEQKIHSQTTTASWGILRSINSKNFINRLMRNRIAFTKLTEGHLKILNDRACYYNNQIFGKKIFKYRALGMINSIPSQPSLTEQVTSKINKLYSVVQNKLIQLDQQIVKFSPESRNKIVWDTVMAFIRLYFLVLIPLEITFQGTFFYSTDVFNLTVIFIILLLLDTLFNFNTAYYQYGSIVRERSEIFKHVISKAFGFDLLSIFYLIIYLILYTAGAEPQNLPWAQICLISFFVQYENIMKLIRQLEEVMNLGKITSSILELAKLITLLIYILHVSCCIWYGCGRLSESMVGDSWLNKYDLTDQTWQIQYLRSFYFCTVTMFTVGYGDYNPQTNLEYIVCIIFIMIFSIQLPYSVNTVGAIIHQISQYSDQKMQKLRIINFYMAKKKISYELQSQIRQYLNYYWEIQNDQEKSEEKIIVDQLSEQLREQLMIEANSQIFSYCDLLNSTFSDQFKTQLVKKIRQMIIQPENIVDLQFDQEKRNGFLCFIEQGEFEVLYKFQEQDVVVGQLKQNQLFGLSEFIKGQKPREQYRSVGFAKLLYLQRVDFLKIMKDFPLDREKFCQIRDDLVFNRGQQYQKLLGERCYLCQSIDHHFQECSLLAFKPDRELIIKSYQFNHDNPRKEYSRSKRLKNCFYAVKDAQIIAAVSEFIQNDFWKDMQIYDYGDNEQISSPRQGESESSADEYVPQRKQSGDPGKQSEDLKKNFERQSRMSIRKTKIQELNDRRQTRRNPTQFIRYGSRQTQSIILPPQILEQSSQASSPQRSVVHIPSLQNFTISEQEIDSQNQVESNQMMNISGQDKPQKLDEIVEKKEDSIVIIRQNQSDFAPSPLNSVGAEQDNRKERIHKVKVKFQKAFNFIQRLKGLSSSVKQRSPPRESMSSPDKRDKNEQQTNLGQIKQRIHRKSGLIKYDENEQLTLLTLRLKMALNDHSNSADEIDSQHDFKIYNVQNNLNQMKISLKIIEQFQVFFKKYSKYLFFPNIYISRYKQIIETTSIHQQIDENKNKSTFATKFNAYRDILKVRNKARQIISRRQVAPQQTIS